MTSKDLDRLHDCLDNALATGIERTSLQDVGLGLGQLTDVAVKALSPGINDPTTAIHALHHSTVLLAELLRHDLGPDVLRDADGEPRVVIRRLSFTDLLEVAVVQPGIYGRDDPAVGVALLGLLRSLAWVAVAREDRAAINAHVSRFLLLVDRGEPDEVHRAALQQMADEIARVSSREAPTGPGR